MTCLWHVRAATDQGAQFAPRIESLLFGNGLRPRRSAGTGPAWGTVKIKCPLCRDGQRQLPPVWTAGLSEGLHPTRGGRTLCLCGILMV